jgi:hypothetical protein
MTERHLIDPTPELPDDTPIENIRFPARLRNMLAARRQNIGEVRETDDKTLLSFQDLGPDSVTYLRKTLGLPSSDGVRPRAGPAGERSGCLQCAFSVADDRSLRNHCAERIGK